MTRPAWKQRAVANVKAKASAKDATAGDCKWCDLRTRKPSQAALGKGLNRSMCRQHADHLGRHGHPLKPSYKATDLRPLEALARRWLNRELKVDPLSPVVRQAVTRARNIILEGQDQGQVLPTKTKPKALAIIGRLHSKYCGERYEGIRTRWPKQRSVDALAADLVAIALAVELAHAFDPAPASNPRFVETQIGKVVFRRSGGWHRRIERKDHSKVEYRADAQGRLHSGPALRAVELNRYASSRGPALTLIGQGLRGAIGLLWQAHGEGLEALAREALLPAIANWTLERRNPVGSSRGGARMMAARNRSVSRPHDKVRPLTRLIP